MNFVFADPGSPPEAAPATPADAIAGDDFFPGIGVAASRAVMRLVTDVTDARLRDALIGGMIAARRELAGWRAAKITAGVATLAAVDPETLDGENLLVRLWERAVRNWAAAELAETHSDISATMEGHDRAQEVRVPTVDERRKAFTHAIRDILGVGRNAVELI